MWREDRGCRADWSLASKYHRPLGADMWLVTASVEDLNLATHVCCISKCSFSRVFTGGTSDLSVVKEVFGRIRCVVCQAGDTAAYSPKVRVRHID